MTNVEIGNELTDYESLTPAMRHVVDALAEGLEPSSSILAALSPREVQEARLLSRTARLTHLTLQHQPAIGTEAEAEALRLAQTALTQRLKTRPASVTARRGGLLNLLQRLRGRSPRVEGEEETR